METLFCGDCGGKLEPGEKFCGSCGVKIESDLKICGNCGAELKPGKKFCTNCGTAVNGPATETAGPTDAAPAKAKSAKMATPNKKRLFWPVFISVVLDGIIGGLFFAFFFRTSGDIVLLGAIICVITGVIVGVHHMIEEFGGSIISENFTIGEKIFFIFSVLFGGVIGGGLIGGIIGLSVGLLFSKIPYGLLVNTSSMVSIAIGIIIGVLMGGIGFIGVFFIAWFYKYCNRK